MTKWYLHLNILKNLNLKRFYYSLSNRRSHLKNALKHRKDTCDIWPALPNIKICISCFLTHFEKYVEVRKRDNRVPLFMGDHTYFSHNVSCKNVNTYFSHECHLQKCFRHSFQDVIPSIFSAKNVRRLKRRGEFFQMENMKNRKMREDETFHRTFFVNQSNFLDKIYNSLSSNFFCMFVYLNQDKHCLKQHLPIFYNFELTNIVKTLILLLHYRIIYSLVLKLRKTTKNGVTGRVFPGLRKSNNERSPPYSD